MILDNYKIEMYPYELLPNEGNKEKLQTLILDLDNKKQKTVRMMKEKIVTPIQ